MNNDEMGGGFGSGLAPTLSHQNKDRHGAAILELAEMVRNLQNKIEKLERMIEGDTKSNFEEMFSEDDEE